MPAPPTRSCRSRRSTRSARGCCARRRSRPASTRSPRPSRAADRLAMLLERIDELPLALARPARQPERAARLDRRSGSTGSRTSWSPPRDYAAWAAKLPEDGEAERARAAREREFAAIYAAHDRMLGRGGHARLRRPRPARVPAAAHQAARARAARARASGTCSSTSSRTRTSPRACCCGCSSPSTATSPRRPTTTRRSTASAARRRRTSPTSAPSGRTRRSCG